MSDGFAFGVAAFRRAAVALAQKHMEPRLARQLVAQSGAKTPFAGFVLAMEHLRDDLLYAPDIVAHNRDSDGTATAAANGDLPVPQDCQARVRRTSPRKDHNDQHSP